MRLFYDLFPDIAEKEMLSIQVENEGVPDGIYSFVEYFCDNLACRCTMAALDVLFFESRDHKEHKQIAYVNYDWGKPVSKANPVLHEDATQSDMAEAALTVFRNTLKGNTSYAKKVNEHFEMIRSYVRSEEQRPFERIKNTSKSGRNGPCPCGSGKKYKKCCL